MVAGGRRGFSLVEIVVASALVAATVLMVMGLIPFGVTSLKKAENMQAATAYGVEVLEARRASILQERPAIPDAIDVRLNQTEFHVESTTRTTAHPAGRLVDISVTVTWNRQPVPVVLATRVYRPGTDASP